VKTAADAPSVRAALALELPKKTSGAGGMAEDAEKIPGLLAKGSAEAKVVALEAAYTCGKAPPQSLRRAGEVPAWQEATPGDSWILVSPFLRAAAPVMLATHARNLDKECVGIFELEYALTNTDFVESGFAYLDRATWALCGAGMSSCIGVAHASILGVFQVVGGRPEAAKEAVRNRHRATSSSSNGMAFDKVDVGAMEAEFEITSLFKPFKAGRSGIIRYLQRRYQDDAAVASREAPKAEASARLARLRKKKQDHIRLCAAWCDK
jgi:hypothetical protein